MKRILWSSLVTGWFLVLLAFVALAPSRLLAGAFGAITVAAVWCWLYFIVFEDC